MRTLNKVEPTWIHSEFRVQENVHKGTQVASQRNAKSEQSGPHSSLFGVRGSGKMFTRGHKSQPPKCENANSKLSGLHSDSFGVRRLLKEETQDKSANCEIQAEGRRSNDSPFDQEAKFKGAGHNQREIIQQLGSVWRQASLNERLRSIRKGVFDELGVKGLLSIERL